MREGGPSISSMGESLTYTVDDLFTLPGLGTRTELIDAGLMSNVR